MNKLLIGIIVGAALTFGGVALAENKGMVIVDGIAAGSLDHLEKVYDYNNGVVCYLFYGGPSGTGISCLHNHD